MSPSRPIKHPCTVTKTKSKRTLCISTKISPHTKISCAVKIIVSNYIILVMLSRPVKYPFSQITKLSNFWSTLVKADNVCRLLNGEEIRNKDDQTLELLAFPQSDISMQGKAQKEQPRITSK